MADKLVAPQIAQVLAKRAGFVALFPSEVTEMVLGSIGSTASRWADALTDPERAEDAGAALWQGLMWDNPDPDPEWWTTPLGLALGRAGQRPPGSWTKAEVADVLGLSVSTVRRRFGSGRVPADAVVEALVVQTAPPQVIEFGDSDEET